MKLSTLIIIAVIVTGFLYLEAKQEKKLDMHWDVLSCLALEEGNCLVKIN